MTIESGPQGKAPQLLLSERAGVTTLEADTRHWHYGLHCHDTLGQNGGHEGVS